MDALARARCPGPLGRPSGHRRPRRAGPASCRSRATCAPRCTTSSPRSRAARSRTPSSLAALHVVYAEAVAAGTLGARADGSVGLEWRDDEPRRVRFAVAADAVALIGDAGRLDRLHRCPGRDCGWIFLDTSGRRRWCSMATCGSREKMRRMYARKRAAEQA